MCSAISLVFQNEMLLLFLLLVFRETISQENQCKTILGAGIRNCAKKVYQPEDLIIEATNKPVALNLISMSNRMNLTIPNSYANSSYGEYSSIYLSDSCVENIEEGFFHKLDRNSNKLKQIKFYRVKCLRSLRISSFDGIGKSLEKLSFDSMPDLIVIDGGFFKIFSSLKRLDIVNTNISSIPQNFLSIQPGVDNLMLYNNKLTSLPDIPSDRRFLIKSFQAYGNPFHCECSMMGFIEIMTTDMKSQDYRCSTPSHLNGKHLTEVGNLCISTTLPSKTTTVINISRSEEIVSVGNVRIEIIIGISVVLLMILLAIVITFICRQKRKKSKKKVFYTASSPSKIIYQDQEYGELFIPRRSDVI